MLRVPWYSSRTGKSGEFLGPALARRPSCAGPGGALWASALLVPWSAVRQSSPRRLQPPSTRQSARRATGSPKSCSLMVFTLRCNFLCRRRSPISRFLVSLSLPLSFALSSLATVLSCPRQSASFHRLQLILASFTGVEYGCSPACPSAEGSTTRAAAYALKAGQVSKMRGHRIRALSDIAFLHVFPTWPKQSRHA